MKKPFRCLQSASVQQRFTLSPLSRRKKWLYVAMELVTVCVFVLLAVLASQCMLMGG